ncbi:ADYC domain-containing protein [Nannocystis punicea]|uniref:ADYC domain-containing protein n=1 Tax=Nannocystis punicea TaxID=2995304 RepID=A0ABY7HBR0_9BACT|nr:ADYC domain-containing protein [Nannocystis poenicansa]WAS96697.1 ADYC domain-containing protein [Nannocystis poenicansa]
MRTLTNTLLAINTVLALNAGACAGLSADSDGFGQADDDSIDFRDTGDYVCPGDIRCLENSPWIGEPWVGGYAFSNIPWYANNPKPDPYGHATFEMTAAKKVIDDVEKDVTLVVGDEGLLKARRTDNLQQVSVTGTTFRFTIDPTDGDPSSTAQVVIKSETTPSSGTYFDVPRYEILTDLVPDDTDTFPEDPQRPGWYHVCPQVNGANKAIVLKHVLLQHDDNMAALSSDDQTVVLACERQALAKGATNLEVLPNSGSNIAHDGATVSRNYGISNYNALINAYRAFYSGDARTLEGTQVFFKDVANSPPLFDQVDPGYLPPNSLLGYYDFFLESVYEGTSGAACRAYTAAFPLGVHRNASYSPPGLVFAPPAHDAWDAMDNCDDSTHDLADHGSVAAYVIEFVATNVDDGS